MTLKRVRNIAFVMMVVLGAFTRANVSAVGPGDYCGDGTCQEDGCSNCGGDTPGNGCRENVGNCWEDCHS